MDDARLLDHLAADFDRLQAVAVTHSDAAVPSCPGWTVADLARHVGEVYLHKALCMREGVEPEPWPPAELAGETPLALLDRAYAQLRGEFAAHRPGDPAGGWYPLDRTVRFWIRRMAHETVIHRIDAELAAGHALTPVPDELARDGIDEVLHIFLAFSVREWHNYFAEILRSPGHTTAVRTAGAAWLIRTGPGSLSVTGPAADPVPDATVTGAPAAVLRWLWNREDASTEVQVAGDADAITRLKRCLVVATQ